jgi:bifunctional enzyme CysN/CysC
MSHQSDLIATDIDAYLAQHERKELLRLLTCGSVDDGKSTLIGRLMYDSKMIYEDQLAAIEQDSAKVGTTGDRPDLALLVDGLQAEREQGITIDVAYRYFSTAKRKFIIADTPGHEQYTRNMATGASNCDLAIILIDARHGMLTQTRRHSFIAALLGIKHIVVAVNKMDIVDYSQEVYDKIVADYTEFATKLEMTDVRFVPLSALEGDNVVNPSENMPWYTGSTLMHILENVHIASDRNFIDMRFPVQYVNRPHLNFRGFAGTLASGVVRPGDEVVALPSRKTSKVKTITTYEGDIEEAFPPQSVTLTLEDEIDVSRGDMIVHARNMPRVDDLFEAMVVWIAEEPLDPGKQYIVKQTTNSTPGIVTELHYRIDVNTLHSQDAETLALNEIGRCVIETAKPLCFDPYKDNRGTGAFIIVDRMSNNTVGAGMILDRDPRRRKDGADAEAKDSHVSPVTATQRALRLEQQPATVWLTGLTGSGKTTLAYALERRLFDEGKLTHVIDGRNARLGLNVDLDFSQHDRHENLRRAAEVAKLFNEAGLISICAFLSPLAADRDHARGIIGDDKFIEIHLDAPAETCADRANESTSAKHHHPFFDTQAPYEAPAEPALTLDTAALDIDACVEQIVDLLKRRGITG